MASHTRGPRGRSRKPRPGGSSGAVQSQARSSPRAPMRPAAGKRPPAPWHPLPLSELLILVGAIAFVLAISRLTHGLAAGGPLLLAGVLAVGLGTGEVTWREHRSGFRSHTLLLAFIPVLALHTLVVVGYTTLVNPSRALNLTMFAVDAIVFVLLFRALRARFLDARARSQTGARKGQTGARKGQTGARKGHIGARRDQSS